ncbi:MAG TPA: DUF4402 domain-containing protein [Phenylobacterium sp.]|nr:DUF4402 domain-containing protein [Phenylobacterium sp.]
MKIIIKGALAALLLAGAASPALAQATDTESGSGSVTIFQPITVTKNADLKFGNIVRPSSGTGSATVSTAGARSTVNAVGLASGDAPQAAQFTVDGEGGQLFTLAVPASFSVTSGANSILVTTSQDVLNGTQTLGGSLGSPGSKVVNIGGSIPVDDTTASGAYLGSFNVTATYN